MVTISTDIDVPGARTRARARRGYRNESSPSSPALAEFGIRVRDGGRVEQRVPCPQCAKGDRDDALGVNVETGVFHCFRCGWAGRLGAETDALRPPPPSADPELVERRRERLRRTWSEAVTLDDAAAEPVRRYLTSRGLAAVLEQPPAVLRAHPALDYFDAGDRLGAYPAMLALFTAPDGSPVTIHATYLQGDGSSKLDARSCKKLLGVPVRGATRGGAIRLYEPQDGVLGVAEGIETALSLHLLQGVPVWAAYCADALARVRLPRDTTTLYVASDGDAVGERSAARLAERVQRWRPRMSVHVVRSSVGDLNDELVESTRLSTFQGAR